MKRAFKFAFALAAVQFAASAAVADQRFVDKRTAQSLRVQPAVRTVTIYSTNGPCPTFSAAYAASVASGPGKVTILPLSDGVFQETLNINSSGSGLQIHVTSNIYPQLKAPVGADAIDVNLGDSDTVEIYNLTIIGGNNQGNNGINVTNARGMELHNVKIRGFGQRGVFFQPGGASQSDLLIINSEIGTMTGGCIAIRPTGSTAVNFAIFNTLLHHCQYGLRPDGSGSTGIVAGVIRDSHVSNTGVGMGAFGNPTGTRSC